MRLTAKLHLSVSSGVYCQSLFDKIDQIPIDFELVNEIEYFMLLLSSESKTPNNRTTFSEILTFSVCKSQKRNLSLSSQLNDYLEDKNEENPNESFNLNSANTRKSPRKKILYQIHYLLMIIILLLKSTLMKIKLIQLIQTLYNKKLIL